MIPVIMGGLSAASLGVADFIASQNSERIGAARSLAGMLLVSSVMLTIYMLIQGEFGGLFVHENRVSILLACVHGATMAIALLLFFYAMSIGKISVVAPIVAAHPMVVVAYHANQGAQLSATQLAAVIGILFGVALVGAGGDNQTFVGRRTKHFAKRNVVVAISLASSLIYGIAILFVQKAAAGIADLQVLWFGRCVGLVTVLVVLLAYRRAPFPPSAKWWGLFTVHGVLDSGGLLFLLFGTNGSANDSITAVIASTFPVITMGLAWAVLNERIRPLQLLGAGIVFGGVFSVVAN